MEDGTAQALAIDELDAQARLHQAQRRADARWACSDDERIERAVLSATWLARVIPFDDVLGCLSALAHGVPDEAHAAELAGDIHTRAPRLKMGVDDGQLHTL